MLNFLLPNLRETVMIKGVTPDEYCVILDILAPWYKKYDFYFYGSRVKGDYRPLSDLDIMIKGSCEADFDDIDMLKSAFDNSNLPYIVNFADYYRLSGDFYNLIKNDLIEIPIDR